MESGDAIAKKLFLAEGKREVIYRGSLSLSLAGRGQGREEKRSSSMKLPICDVLICSSIYTRVYTRISSIYRRLDV